MQNPFIPFLLLLFIQGVFGADVLVNEGDSVTLQTGVTKIQNDDVIMWMFGPKDMFLSQITRKDDLTPNSFTDDAGFRGRLQVDQNTGSLTIRNTRIRHAGQYKLSISSEQILTKIFKVTVESVANETDGVKSVSVKEGDSVTLKTDVEVQRDDLIVWRFGDKGILLAKIDVGINETSLNKADERFRDRLKIDHQTKSLIITNTGTKHSGLYEIQIRDCESSQRFLLSVNAPGLSPVAVAGIVIGVLLLVLAVAAAAAVGVIYYRRKISELESQKLKKVFVMEGDDVTLNTDVTKIQKDDLVEWRFGDGGHLIAELRGGIAQIYDTGLNESFTDRLKLDKKTGSLTIKNSRNTDSGLYQLLIHQDSKIKYRMFYVSVCVTNEVRNISVKEGKSMILNSETEIQKDDQILWRFGDKDILIAEVRGGTRKTHDDVADGKFKGILVLDEKTGSLIITDMRIKHAGDYKLQIISSRGNRNKTFVLTVYSSLKSVTEGKSITLNPGTEIQKDDLIQWMFGDILIAEVRGTGETHDDDGRFRGRLTLDETTGSLTIARMRDEHTGYYKLQISSSRGNTNKRFKVVVVCNLLDSLPPPSWKLLEESAVNDSAAVQMPPVNEEDPDLGNKQEGMSLLVMR